MFSALRRVVLPAVIAASVWPATGLAGDCFGPRKKDEPEELTPRQIARAEALFKKGHNAYDKGKALDAEELYREAIEINPGESRYHRQLAVLLTAMSRAQEAEREALLATHCDPDDWRSLLMLAEIWKRQGRAAEAIDLYDHALRKLPPEEKAVADHVKKMKAQTEQILNAEREEHKKRTRKDEELMQRAIERAK